MKYNYARTMKMHINAYIRYFTCLPGWSRAAISPVQFPNVNCFLLGSSRMEIRSYICTARRAMKRRGKYLTKIYLSCYEPNEKQVGEESDSSGSERSPKQAKRRNRGGAPPATRRRKSGISARERNLRRLESNERERMRMHSLNDAFEVTVYCFLAAAFASSLRRRARRTSLKTFEETRNFRCETSRTIRVKIMNVNRSSNLS